MKCLCGFNQKPENIVALKRHVEDCMTTGMLQDTTTNPIVVWRNRQFMVVTELQHDEVGIDAGIVRPDVARLRLENKIAAEKIVVDFDGNIDEVIAEAQNTEPEKEEEKEAVKPAARKPSASKKTTARAKAPTKTKKKL
jgi:hypothetical protein